MIKKRNISITLLLLLMVFCWDSLAQSVYYPEEEGGSQRVSKKNYGQRGEDEILSEASRQYNLGGFVDALAIYDEIIKNDPYNTEAYYGRAICREALEDFEGALVDYEILIHLNPEWSEAYFNSGILRYNLKDYERAVPLFQKLLSLPTGKTQAIYFGGVKNSPDATPILTEVVSMADGKEVLVFNYLGKCYEALDDFDEADLYYSKAIEINPSPELYISRGNLRKVTIGKEAAMLDFKSALQMDPENSLALYLLSELSQEEGNPSHAIEALDKVLAGNRPFAEAYMNRGLAKYQAEDYKGALIDYDSAISLNGNIYNAWLYRGLVKEKLQDFNGAIADYGQVIRLSKDIPQAYLYRGNSYFKKGEYERALKDYNQAIAIDNADPKAFYNRALVGYKLNQEDQPCQDLQKAITLGMTTARQAQKAYCDAN